MLVCVHCRPWISASTVGCCFGAGILKGACSFLEGLYILTVTRNGEWDDAESQPVSEESTLYLRVGSKCAPNALRLIFTL